MSDEFAEVAKIQITLHKNGNVTIGGNIGNLAGTLAILDHAKDCVRRYHNKLSAGEKIIIPEHDTSIPRPKHYTMGLETGEYKFCGARIG